MTDEPALDAFFVNVPGRWAICLLADLDGSPVQLLCAKNLRASLKRRFTRQPAPQTTRRVDYQSVIRRIYWRRVDSSFEANWLYFEAARNLFPDSYTRLLGYRKTWWVHVDPQAQYPRYECTDQPDNGSGVYFGPINDKQSAVRYVQMIENLFDLCRDHRRLAQAPESGPCAWKQMGRCVGPCDGSISLDGYRQLIAHTVGVLSDPDQAVELQQQRMRAAAGELRFELAQQIKQYCEQLAELKSGKYRKVLRLDRFSLILFQPGPAAKRVNVFLVRPGRIEHLLCLVRPPDPTTLAGLLNQIDQRMTNQPDWTDPAQVERLHLVSRYFLKCTESELRRVVPVDQADVNRLAEAYRSASSRQKVDDRDSDDVASDIFDAPS